MEPGFLAVDVETARRAAGSICQVGVASFCENQFRQVTTTLIDPCCAISATAHRIHGLTAADLADAPRWQQFYPEFMRALHGATLVSHGAFDRMQIFAACRRTGQPMFSYRRWLDTCAMARRHWPGLPSYSLRSLADRHGIRYRAHDAGEDARAAGELLLRMQSSRFGNQATA